MGCRHPWEIKPAKVELTVEDAIKSITCPKCGMISYNSNDIEYRYCGNCHQFHKDMEESNVPRPE